MTDDVHQQTFWETEHNFRAYDHPVVSFFAQQRLDFISQWVDWRHVNSALDVGCGSGFSTYYLRQKVADIWGVDRSKLMLSQHPMRRENKLGVVDAFHLPFADNSFDLVYGWEVLHHISDPLQIVLEISRVSRRYVLLVEPNARNPAQFLFALVDPAHRWVLRYSRPYMQQLIKDAGLELVQAATGGWLFPNVTPLPVLPLIKLLPYQIPFGISNWVLGRKASDPGLA